MLQSEGIEYANGWDVVFKKVFSEFLWVSLDESIAE